MTRLLHSSRKRSGNGCFPFIRVIVLNEEEEEAEAEKAESEKQKRNVHNSSLSTIGSHCERRSLDRMVNGLLKMEMDVAASINSSLSTNDEGKKAVSAMKNHQQIEKYLLELPEKIV